MAEQNDSQAATPDAAASPVTSRRSMRELARSAHGRVTKTQRAVARVARPAITGRSFRKPLRSVVILSMVGGLVATVALPAYAAFNTAGAEAQTVEQVAADNAQSLVVASSVTTTGLDRGTYAATTAEEVEKKKAAEAAAARIAASGSVASFSTANIDLNMVAPGSGAVRWPLDMSQITVGRGFGADGYHQGVDLLGAAGTPEFAAAAGTVRVAGWYYGYGYAVVLDSVINGQSVTTLYGHMTQTLVSPGEYVEAGQMIGLMGSTGSSTANHLHFEVRIGGGLVDPYAWLQANAG